MHSEELLRLIDIALCLGSWVAIGVVWVGIQLCGVGVGPFRRCLSTTSVAGLYFHHDLDPLLQEQLQLQYELAGRPTQEEFERIYHVATPY